ncbi:MAG TPA: efflux RND transporter permease subunit [Gemmataceae bacterium]|nr:efflux RND transporter permease subunit [Gemmataceae bacterium]
MIGLIRFSLNNWHAVVVFVLTIIVIGMLALLAIPVDILPVFKSPAVQVLTFYGGMPADGIEKDISVRMERWTGQANGMKWQESRSISGTSIVRNYFHDGEDPNGALTQVNSLALATLPYLPPGTLPPVVLPFDPTSTTPVAIIAMDSKTLPEEKLYDVGRLEVRNFVMQNHGTIAPVVIGGKLRAVMLYLNPSKMQARELSPSDVMTAVEKYHLFFPSGDVKIGDKDVALSSNSQYSLPDSMGSIPIHPEPGKYGFLNEIAEPKDSAFIQTNVVLVNGRRQVYIPIYRQGGASTLAVVDQLKDTLPEIKAKLSEPDINLNLVMDQSVYVRAAIKALVQEGVTGAILCSLVILLFLGQWRMTMIAIVTLPLSVFTAVVCLWATGNTINVMTLAGLTLAIGPMIDSAIICLENTHRHLGLGATPKDAALRGASEVAMPELVSSLCTFLVLTPLILVPGIGRFLFLPMTLAVVFAMTTAYILSRTVVPCASAYLLSHRHPHAETTNPIALAFRKWEALIDRGIQIYTHLLDMCLRHRWRTVIVGFTALAITLAVLVPILRRDFFPESDSGAFEIALSAPAGTRIENTEAIVRKVDKFIRDTIPAKDLQLTVCEIGTSADWSAAYTRNSGPMDAAIKVQLTAGRARTAQEYVRMLRDGFAKNREFANLEFSFDSGGLIRGALNEGRASPITVRLVGKNQGVLFGIADKILASVKRVDGVVDARVLQKPNAPEIIINVDKEKAQATGLSQDDIMKNVIAATNSSIMYNKRSFWIDPKSGNQYFVGVQYPEQDFSTTDDILNIPITSPKQGQPIPLRNVATITHADLPTEVHHVNIQPAIDITMNVEGRDLGHVSNDVAKVLEQFGKKNKDGSWAPYDPASKDGKTLEGSKIELAGEYRRMQDTFSNLGGGLILASLLIYFLMVALDRSFIVPLAVMAIVPLCLIGILPTLLLTRSAINVQSLLGFIFIVGIKVANSVLMTDYAQELRRHEGLSPMEAIRKAAALRVRPVTMTALAAFFAMIPTALALEKGSEANAPLARTILGGLIAGEPATLFVLPCVYALLVRDKKSNPPAGDMDALPDVEPVH